MCLCCIFNDVPQASKKIEDNYNKETEQIMTRCISHLDLCKELYIGIRIWHEVPVVIVILHTKLTNVCGTTIGHEHIWFVLFFSWALKSKYSNSYKQFFGFMFVILNKSIGITFLLVMYVTRVHLCGSSFKFVFLFQKKKTFDCKLLYCRSRKCNNKDFPRFITNFIPIATRNNSFIETRK